MTHKITAKGQITIPKKIRDHLRVKPGDRVKIFAHPNGSAVILPVRPISALRGILKTTRRVSLKEMDDAVGAGAVASMGRNFQPGTSARGRARIAKRS